MLDEIAAMILDHVQVKLADVEYELLDVTYKHLKKVKKLGQLRDAMKFLNYNRDYSCTVPQFVQLFRANFNMSDGQIQDYQIKILMQKYAADADNAASILASGKKRDEKFIKNQRIVYLQMIIDFGNRNKGIPF